MGNVFKIVSLCLLIGVILLSKATATFAYTDQIAYYFDSNNGYDGNSLWGIPLDTLPVQNGYHLPATEGYIGYEDQYDILANETKYGFGYYINSQWPDGVNWHWDGEYDNLGFKRPPGLWWDREGNIIGRDPKPAKVLIYAPWTGKACVAVIGDSGPAPWTGRQFGVSNKVFDALGLPSEEEGYTRADGKRFSRGDPNPEHALPPLHPNTDPLHYPVIKYQENPYWVKVFWAPRDALPGPLTRPSPPSGERTATVLIMDVSGSMGWEWQGEVKLKSAQKVASQEINLIEQEARSSSARPD